MASYPDLAVSGTVTAPALELTALNKGLTGIDIDLRMNYYGQAGGEYTPAGLTVDITPIAGGTANPDITDGLANLSDQTFDYIVSAYTDPANLNALEVFLNNSTGRWSWEEMIYGHAFAAYRGTLGELTAFGNSRNDQHCTIMGFADSPDPAWVWAAQLGGFAASSLRADPGMPVQYITTFYKAPPVPSRLDHRRARHIAL